MKISEEKKNNRTVTVLSMRRSENGVEIFEQEMHEVITLNEAQSAVEPRLVIGDAVASATQLFISKTRSEIAGLENFLLTLSNPTANAR